MSYWCLIFTVVLFPFSSMAGKPCMLLLHAFSGRPIPFFSIFIIIITEFAEVPSNCNVTVELGTPPPPCRCRHILLDAIITWSVNGSPLGLFPNITSGSIIENGSRVDTLTIPAEPQYNGAVVECLAVFTDGSPTERTPAATILFTPTNSSTSDRGNFTQFQCRMH